jgi:hypothetical protein
MGDPEWSGWSRRRLRTAIVRLRITILRPLVHALAAAAFALRITASRPVPVTVVLVIAACETIAIAPPVLPLIVLRARRRGG